MSDEVFINTEKFGDLFITDVLLSYIYPRCFICQDKFESNYLFYEIRDDDVTCTWNVVKITKKEYFLLCDKKKPIQYCFQNARSLDRFSFVKDYDSDMISVSTMTDEQLNELPVEDVYSEKVVSDNLSADTLQESREKFASILDFRFYPGSNRHSLPSTYLNEIINNVKSVFKTFFNYKREEPIQTCTVAGSCIVRFQFPDMMNLFNQSNAKNELDLFSKVLAKPSILDGAQLVKDKKEFITKYTALLNTLIKIGGDVQISNASPNSNEVNFYEMKANEIKIRHNEAKNIFEIKEETVTKQGKLVAFDSAKRKFKLVVNGDCIEGEIDKKWNELDAIHSVNGNYNAQLKMTTKVDEDNFSTRITYMLIGLTPINL